MPTAPGVFDHDRDHRRFLERIVAEHRAPLTRYAGRLLGDGELARDVVQDTFMRLMGQDASAVDGHVAEWLFAVCRNRALDVLRREGRMRPLGEDEGAEIVGHGPDPSLVLETAETHERLLVLIDQLPPNQQEVVRLKFQNGFNYKEIARITQLSVSNVGFLLHTAIARMRRDWARDVGQKTPVT
jgi:RNA polymerase sigma factor (sigma-70 family)